MPKWDRYTIITAIQLEMALGFDLSYQATLERNLALHRAARRHFGSWREAIEAAGFDYDAIRKYQIWSTERVLETIRAYAEKGEDLSFYHVATVLDPPLAAAVFHGDRFPSWNAALEAAGLDPESIARYQRWSTERIQEQLTVLAHEQGKSRYDEVKDENPALVAATYRKTKRFTSVRDATVGPLIQEKKLTAPDSTTKTNAISVTAKPAATRQRWNTERIIAMIREAKQHHDDLSYHAMRKAFPSLIKAAKRYFGGWEQALEAAGISYADVRKRQGWNIDKIIRRIKYWHAKGESLNYHYVAETLDPTLIWAALNPGRFANWDAALIAAGIDPETTRQWERWTPEKILAELAELATAGIHLTNRALSQHAPALLSAIYRIIGSLPEARRRMQTEYTIPGGQIVEKSDGTITSTIPRAKKSRR